MLPRPIWPLAQHARFGQNCSDGSIGSVVVCLHTHNMPRTAFIFKLFPLFHQLVGLYQQLPPQENIEIFSMIYSIETALREIIIDALSAVEGSQWYRRRLPPRF